MEESSTIQAFIEEGRRKGLEEGLSEGKPRRRKVSATKSGEHREYK